MDIYKFINSKDIREYLRDIDYKFSVEEYLYFIHRSQCTTLKEKHLALEELTKEFPNYVLPASLDLDKMPLSDFVTKYISIQNEYVDIFFKDDPLCTYYSAFLFDTIWHGDKVGYATFEEAFDNYYNNEFDQHSFEYQTQITRKHVCSDINIKATFLQDKSIVDIDIQDSLDETNKWMYLEYFDSIIVNTPVPFEKGDLLINIVKKDEDAKIYTGEQDPNVIVFSELCNKYDDEAMGIRKYVLSDNGKVERVTYERAESYLDFEKYRGKLQGKLYILKAISSYIKDEISLDLLLNAYWIIRQKYNADNELFTIGYDEDMQYKAGLIEAVQAKRTVVEQKATDTVTPIEDDEIF